MYVFTGKNKKNTDLTNFIDTVEKVHPIAVNLFSRWQGLFLSSKTNIASGTMGFIDPGSMVKGSEAESSVDDMYRDDNFITPYIEMFIGKMVGGMPSPFVLPRTDDIDDYYNARIETAVARSWWDTQKFVLKWARALHWAAITGVCYFKHGFDQSNEVMADFGTEKFREGEVSFRGKSPFMVFPDFTVSDPDDREWYVETYIVPDYRIERYVSKNQFDNMKQDGTTLSNVNTNLFGFDSQYEHGDGQSSSMNIPSYIVREFWQKPMHGVDHGFGKGKGRLLVRGGGVTIYDGENPYPILPYTQYSIRVSPDTSFGDGIVDSLIPSNRKLNRLNKIIMQNYHHIGNTIPLIPEGSEWKTIDGIGGSNGLRALEYSPLYPPPSTLQVSQMPPNSLNYIQHLVERMHIQAGMTDISFGQLPTGSHGLSGLGMDNLMEAERTRYSMDSLRLKDVMVTQTLMGLILIKEFYKTKRIAKIVGELGMQHVFPYKGSELSLEHDIIIELRDGFGATNVMREDRALQLFDRGIINVSDFVQYTDFKYTGMFERYEAIYKVKADLQLIVSGKGEPVVNKWDDHQLCINVFRQFLRSGGAYEFKREKLDLISMYLDQHEAFLNQEMMVQQRQMQMKQQQESNPGGGQPSRAEINQQMSQGPGSPGPQGAPSGQQVSVQGG